VRHAEKHDVGTFRGLSRRDVFENDIAHAAHAAVDVAELLAHVVLRRHAQNLDVAAHEQVAQDLCRAVSGSTDDRHFDAHEHSVIVFAHEESRGSCMHANTAVCTARQRKK